MSRGFKNSNERYHIFAILTLILFFFIPVLGWAPILILGIVNAYMSYKEASFSRFRFFYVAVMLIFSLLAVSNLIVRAAALLQYFGYFTS